MPTDLGTEFLTTRELAELLRIKERKVYELAASGEVPCSRATGKLLFRRKAIDAWIARSSSGMHDEGDAVRAQVFAGSHDPLLEWALRESRSALATYFDGSLDGVNRFASRAAIAAGLHVYEPGEDEWNVPLVRERFANEPAVLIEFAWRERGLIVAGDGDESIAGIAGLRGKRVVPRQAEAGGQVLFEQLIGAAGLTHGDMTLTALARTETDAALAVAEGKADAAFGLRGLARQFRLGFVPLVRERFDLLVDRRSWFEPPLQRFFEFCGGESFRDKASELQGYDVSGAGRVRFNGA
jgi:excisionase family DNA binding protein